MKNKAISCFDKAIKCFQKDQKDKGKERFKHAWYGKGLLILSLGRHEDAVWCFDKATKIEDNEEDTKWLAKVWYHKGVSYSSLKRYDEAIELFL